MILALYFIFDAHSIWPESHGFAVSTFAIGVSVVLLAEFPIKLWLIAISPIICGALVIYFAAGSIEIPDVEVSGSLYPGAKSTRGPCPGAVAPDAWRILFGPNAIEFHEPLEFTILRVAQCQAVKVRHDNTGTYMSAELFDMAGNLLASMDENRFHALNGSEAHIKRESDLSRLIILNGDGKELLNINYMNQSTVRIRGIFGCPGHIPVPVTDTAPLPQVRLTGGSCINVLKGSRFRSLLSIDTPLLKR